MKIKSIINWTLLALFIVLFIPIGDRLVDVEKNLTFVGDAATLDLTYSRYGPVKTNVYGLSIYVEGDTRTTYKFKIYCKKDLFLVMLKQGHNKSEVLNVERCGKGMLVIEDDPDIDSVTLLDGDDSVTISKHAIHLNTNGEKILPLKL